MAISHVYTLALQSLAEGRIDFTGGTVKACLLDSTYVPDPTDKFYADLSGEIVGDGYVSGGTVLADTEAVLTGNNRIRWTCSNPAWTGSFTARYLVFYVDGDVSTGDPLISYVDFQSNQTVDDETFTYQVPARGIVEFIP